MAMESKVEVYNSVSQNTCSLEDLPLPRTGHSLCGGLICGAKTCLIWDANTNKFCEVPKKIMWHQDDSLCWAVDDYGILLLGGVWKPRGALSVLADGSDSSKSFDLEKPAR